MGMKNRIAIVTGGTRGIGKSIAVDLKKAGCKVVASYAGNEEAALAFKKETGIEVMRFDVADFEQCQHAVRRIEAEMGTIDILINNAGINSIGWVVLALLFCLLAPIDLFRLILYWPPQQPTTQGRLRSATHAAKGLGFPYPRMAKCFPSGRAG
jgi:NAD(P)-dependent dehydrogenase (short-subunit alcohol dehydrogenase family)